MKEKIRLQDRLEDKQKNLALFQFISLIAVFVLFTGFMILGFTLMNSGQVNALKSLPNWLEAVGHSLIFSSLTPNAIFAGSLFYISIILFLISWGFGWTMFSIKNRNLYDSLFLLFLMIPLLSNVFALIAQLNTKKSEYTDTKINKKKIISDETRLVKLEQRNKIK